jgi:CspA family cold shock protein
MQQGTVIKKNDKGFGFIKVDGSPEGAKDLFFHSNELQNISFDQLMEGDKVSFEIGDSPKGPNALGVNKI